MKSIPASGSILSVFTFLPAPKITQTLPIFNLQVPVALAGVNSHILDPRNTYTNDAVWQEKAEDLASLFIKNFEQYTDTQAGAALVSAGPKLD